MQEITPMDVSVIVPTFNEGPNVTELVDRIETALEGRTGEIVFVDDSTDNTPAIIRAVAAISRLPVRLLHRSVPTGGLSGAVLEGMASSTSDWVVVMDGDLQHPPEVIPALLASGDDQDADVVVASRHAIGGSTAGLSGGIRRLVSGTSNTVTRAMFPIKLRNVTDPMTGFFAIRRSTVDVSGLKPRGFKILLEILARNSVKVVEEPFVFGERMAGESKADFKQGIRFLTQLAALRFGRLSGFAVIGAFGAVANILIMAGLQAAGVWYLAAAVVAAVVTIVANFLLQEHFVFHDLRREGRNVWLRFGQSLAFNGTETVIRTAILWVIVERTTFPSVPVQAALLAIGFLLRFVYHSRIVYRPKRTTTIAYDLDAAPAASAESALGK
jgi:dolichol-phosphate mannosyltransferase